MSVALNTDPDDVRAHPFAVAVKVTDEEGTYITTDFIHFQSKGAAALFAGLLDPERVTRFVATSFDWTWREVTYFNL